MRGDELRAYCLAKPGAWPDEPWEGDTVAKVGPEGKGRIFAFLGDDGVGICCGTREEADELLSRFPDDVAVMPYIGRHGWDTVRIDGAVADDELRELVDASYEIVVDRLPRRHRP